jgi:hypothetical protein
VYGYPFGKKKKSVGPADAEGQNKKTKIKLSCLRINLTCNSKIYFYSFFLHLIHKFRQGVLRKDARIKIKGF